MISRLQDDMDEWILKIYCQQLGSVTDGSQHKRAATQRQGGKTKTSASGGHIMLTPIQPPGNGAAKGAIESIT